jgi:hypothetical protein
LFRDMKHSRIASMSKSPVNDTEARERLEL